LQSPVAFSRQWGFFVLNMQSWILSGFRRGAGRHYAVILVFYAVRFCLNSPNTPYIGHFGLRKNREVVGFAEFFMKNRIF